MTAGYDTTAITMSWLAYELSLHPDIQDRLFEEIDDHIGKVTYYCDIAGCTICFHYDILRKGNYVYQIVQHIYELASFFAEKRLQSWL